MPKRAPPKAEAKSVTEKRAPTASGERSKTSAMLPTAKAKSRRSIASRAQPRKAAMKDFHCSEFMSAVHPNTPPPPEEFGDWNSACPLAIFSLLLFNTTGPDPLPLLNPDKTRLTLLITT